jgi:hypothetical protein
MGAVYRAWHSKLEVEVAVKVLATMDNTSVQRFRQEARLAAQLDHPNLIRVFDVLVEGDCHYIIMGFAQGLTLDEVVRREGQLKVRSALRYLGGAARGIAYAHSRGVIHRDIKPQNLIRSEEGRIKVADLGIAKEVQEQGLTLSRHAMGTPQYMAPEQIRDARSVQPSADVYSLGATLYYLLTAENGIKGDSVYSLFKAACEEPFPDVRDARPDVPDAIAAVIQRCTEKEAEIRYQDGRELLQALKDAATARPPGTVRVGAPARAAEPAAGTPRPRRGAVAALVASVVVVIGGVAWWSGLFGESGDRPDPVVLGGPPPTEDKALASSEPSSQVQPADQTTEAVEPHEIQSAAPEQTEQPAPVEPPAGESREDLAKNQVAEPSPATIPTPDPLEKFQQEWQEELQKTTSLDATLEHLNRLSSREVGGQPIPLHTRHNLRNSALQHAAAFVPPAETCTTALRSLRFLEEKHTTASGPTNAGALRELGLPLQNHLQVLPETAQDQRGGLLVDASAHLVDFPEGLFEEAMTGLCQQILEPCFSPESTEEATLLLGWLSDLEVGFSEGAVLNLIASAQQALTAWLDQVHRQELLAALAELDHELQLSTTTTKIWKIHGKMEKLLKRTDLELLVTVRRGDAFYVDSNLSNLNIHKSRKSAIAAYKRVADAPEDVRDGSNVSAKAWSLYRMAELQFKFAKDFAKGAREPLGDEYRQKARLNADKLQRLHGTEKDASGNLLTSLLSNHR